MSVVDENKHGNGTEDQGQNGTNQNENNGANGDNGSSGNDGNGTGDKTFTQEQVNSMIAAEKRKNAASLFKGLGFESEEAAKEFVEKYKAEEEKNKSELEKEQAKSAQLEAEKQAEVLKAQNLEYKYEALSAGCPAEAVDDVVVLAKAKVSDDKDFAAALKEVKEQYPAMFGQTDNSGGGTGGGGTSPRGKLKTGDLSGIGKRLAEQRKNNNATKENEYFK